MNANQRKWLYPTYLVDQDTESLQAR